MTIIIVHDNVHIVLQASVLLVSLFVTQELNVIVSDVMPTDHNYNGIP